MSNSYDWESAYKSGDFKHWEFNHPSPELVTLVAAGLLETRGRVLEVGCRGGLDAIFLAREENWLLLWVTRHEPHVDRWASVWLIIDCLQRVMCGSGGLSRAWKVSYATLQETSYRPRESFV